ncbi:hypothetical protein SODG_001077 [Sodalis praecaptivus]
MIGQMNEGAAATAAALHVTHLTRPRFAELYGADGLGDDPVSGLRYQHGTVQCLSPSAWVSPLRRIRLLWFRSFPMQNIGNVVQGSESAFSVQEFDLRVARARELLTAAGLDVMIITGPENIFISRASKPPAITLSKRCCCR